MGLNRREFHREGALGKRQAILESFIRREEHPITSTAFNRRDFSKSLAAFFSGLGLAGTAFGSSVPRTSPFAASDEITHACEAIHQEVIFPVSRKRVYEALTDAKQFSQVIHLSEAGMSLGNAPVEISREVGGAF